MKSKYFYLIICSALLVCGNGVRAFGAEKPYEYRYSALGCFCTAYYDPEKINQETLDEVRKAFFEDIPDNDYQIWAMYECQPEMNICVSDKQLKEWGDDKDLSRSEDFLSYAFNLVAHNKAALAHIDALNVPPEFKAVKEKRLRSARFCASIVDSQYRYYAGRDFKFLKQPQTDIDPIASCSAVLEKLEKDPKPYAVKAFRTIVWYEWANCLNAAYHKAHVPPGGQGMDEWQTLSQKAWPRLFTRHAECEATCED